MKKLSETLTELGIAFSFPVVIKDAKGYVTYYEKSDGYWEKWEYDSNGYMIYYESIYGNWFKIENDGKVVSVDGIKYTLTAL